jgi:hypothetical protein
MMMRLSYEMTQCQSHTSIASCSQTEWASALASDPIALEEGVVAC